MRPLPEEVIADVRWTLDNVLHPALDDGFAVEQAQLMSNLLEHVRLRLVLEPRLVREDTEDIRRTLGGLDLPRDLRTVLDTVPAGQTVGDVADLRARTEQLRGVLARCVAELEAAAEDGDAQADAALPDVRLLLRRQLDRERQMLGPGYAVGT